jgi:hypothetical protein
MAAALIPNWAITTALRISAACRHWSQAVLKQRSWIPDIYKEKKSEDAQSESAESQSTAVGEELESEEEPFDAEATEIAALVKDTRTLKWQSEFMASLEREFKDPGAFMDSLFSGSSSSNSTQTPPQKKPVLATETNKKTNKEIQSQSDGSVVGDSLT